MCVFLEQSNNTANKETKCSEIFVQVNNTLPYKEVNITIPLSKSPQLDSKGSSPSSDYSSHSSLNAGSPNHENTPKSLIHEPSIMYSQISKPQTQCSPKLDLPDHLTINPAKSLTEDVADAKAPVCCNCNQNIERYIE